MLRDVSLGHDAAHRPRAVHHWHATNPMRFHQLDALVDALIGPHRDDRVRHTRLRAQIERVPAPGDKPQYDVAIGHDTYDGRLRQALDYLHPPQSWSTIICASSWRPVSRVPQAGLRVMTSSMRIGSSLLRLCASIVVSATLS